MKDQLGLYYYPFPQNKKVRMYVRAAADEPEFRMWNQDDPQMWEAHGWVPYSAIVHAKAMYKGKTFDPDKAYDIQAAKALIAERA
jgi:hypothetical protein